MRKTALSALAAALPLLSALPVQAASYKIDPAHTFATFEINHFGASVNRGRFDRKSGTVEFDKAAKTGKVTLEIDANSINSGTPDFDKHLKTADFFNVARHPTIKFVSDKFVYEGDKLKEVTGNLTLLGKTHPITFKANQFTCYPNPIAKTEACGGDFVAEIDRTQWGMDWGVNMGMPKTVRILAQIEAFKQ